MVLFSSHGCSSAGLPGGDGGADKKLKPCCACPETKQARDKCIVEKGEAECTALIEAHKECLRKNGFKV